VSELDDLLLQVTDEGLRSQLKAGIDVLTRQMKFGLVFERHIPESIRVYNALIAVGDSVQLRAELSDGYEYTVEQITSGKALIRSAAGDQTRTVESRELVVVKKFGDPVYPALRPTGAVHRSNDKPTHPVICGENFHVLQLLRYLYRRQVDCIYIDPPYNTGASDWKYNNRYVDASDRWRHSKWLSFMEKRLILARDLLKDDGVLIVTIDEHEVHHLGMLLEQVFPGYLLHTITIVINPKGTGKLNFSRVNEYALYCIPDTGENIVMGVPNREADMLVGLRTREHEDLVDEDGDSEYSEDESDTNTTSLESMKLPFPHSEFNSWELRHARRRGGESSYRHQRPNQFYPLYVDVEAEQVVRAGESIPLDCKPNFERVDGHVPVWPIDADGNERCWRLVPSSMQQLIDAGRVVLGRPSAGGMSWTINIWVRKTERKKYKTVWWSRQHDAGTHGTTLLHKFLESRTAFPFPKSVYSVRDTLLSVVRDRPDALIVDFFAGSGTTLHATALINQSDGGRRRCVLVSNNEVDAKTSASLIRQGCLPGDVEFEKHGVFWQATRPRVQAAFTGKTPSGKTVQGRYDDGRPFSSGFSENAEFFDLVYLDRDEVRQGTEFTAIEPSLWLMAGGIGRISKRDASKDYAISPSSNYAILFERSAFSAFKKALSARPDVSHVFIVTDSEDAYAQMRSRLPSDVKSSMLYRDYLTNFRINTIEAFR
jgi:adenine-specific DNA-methyltransferase